MRRSCRESWYKVQDEYYNSLEARRKWSISLARIAKFRPLVDMIRTNLTNANKQKRF